MSDGGARDLDASAGRGDGTGPTSDGAALGGDGTDDEAPADREELAAQVELLAEENRRLREEYRRARQTRYRETAAGMAGLGLVALAGAALFPAARDVLLALSGTGLFAAVLLYALTPERFVTESVGEQVVAAHAAAGAAVVADLGLSDARVYLPGGDGADPRLFVPQRQRYEVPEASELDGVFVVDDDRRRGVALPTSGGGLYRSFERDLVDAVADAPGALGEQLADALTEGFELADAARPDAEDGRLSVAVEAPAYGDPGAFDHPIASFLGVAAATALDEPVEVAVTGGDERADALVTVRWPAGDER